MSKSKILFMLSGSIAAFKACQVISKLVQEGHEVQTVATPSALNFIGPATLEGLTGRKVLSDLWEQGHAMEHIQLTRWADKAILCPASANTLAKIAHGMADDLIGALTLAWPKEKPFHVFPAMNSVMLDSPATQANLMTLHSRGFKIASTGSGTLACGEEGEGRLQEPDEILRQLIMGPAVTVNSSASLAQRASASAVAQSSANSTISAPLPKLGRLLVTAGATREAIDGIRFLSNVSTGQTGASLADLLSARGWSVTYLHGQGAMKSAKAAHSLTFSDYNDLDRKLRSELDQRDYLGVLHCAAVADYGIENANSQVKMNSDQPLTLNLKPNPKLLPKLKRYSRKPGLQVIGFKLTLNSTEAETTQRAQELLGENVDAVVANDWGQVNRDRSQHPGWLVRKNGVEPFRTLEELASGLHTLLVPAKEKSHDLMS